MASAVPVAGSAYTYSYATMGELVAWIIGWDLVLEYAAGAATVGVGWSGHLVDLFSNFGITLPANLTNAPTTWCTAANVAQHVAGCAHTGLNLTGAILNLPAVVIVAVDVHDPGHRHQGIGHGQQLHRDPQGRDRAADRRRRPGAHHTRPTGIRSFRPTPAAGAPTAGPACCAARGWSSSPTSASTPSAPPRRNRRIPSATCRSASSASLVICTLLYILVSGVLVGMVPYTGTQRQRAGGAGDAEGRRAPLRARAGRRRRGARPRRR